MKINILTQAVAQGRKYVRENPEKVRAMTTKASDFVDARTGRKHTAQIQKARGAADRYLDKQR